MPHDLTIIVGYSIAALDSLQKLRPASSVVLIEEPDIIRKRSVEKTLKMYPVVRELVAVEHHDWDTAETFYASAKTLKVASVVPILEYATPFAARLAELYKLPGATFAAALSMRNKHRLRQVTSSQDIRNPRSRLVGSFKDALAVASDFGLPVILKPTDRQGSVGTVIVHDLNQLKEAWEQSQQREEGIMTSDRPANMATLVEELIVGPEFSVEALVSNGQVIFINVTAKELFPGTYPVERAHVVPAPIPSSEFELFSSETAKVISATGFNTGIIHCEWIFSAKGLTLVECAGRFAGDGIIDLICRAWDFDIVAAYHKIMRGEIVECLPTLPKKCATVRFLGARDGIIDKIEFNKDALTLPGVVDHHLSVQEGDRTFTPTMSWKRIGSVTVEAHDAKSAGTIAEQALAGIRIHYRHQDLGCVA
jgi:biotin carboxylase